MSDATLSERQIVERVYGWREAVLSKASAQALYSGIPSAELEDVFQESALYLSGRRDIADDDVLRKALWKALRFRVGHYYEHKAVERAAEPQLAAQAYVVDQGDEDPAALAEHALAMAHVNDFLAELCGREQAVFRLTYGEELSRERVARHLAVSELVVKRDLTRSKNVLDRHSALLTAGRVCHRRAALPAAVLREA